MALTQITEKSIKDGELINADINASAAIAGTKIAPNFGSQDITTTGDVGIGTTSPSGTLHIESSSEYCLKINKSDSTAAYIQFYNSTTGSSTSDGFRLGLDSNEDGLISLRESGNVKFSTADTERMRISSGGHVMIGTTTEGFGTYGDEFTIAKSAHAGMTIRSGTASKGSIYFSDGTSGDAEYKGGVQYDHADDSLRLSASASNRVRIDSDGLKFGSDTAAANALDDYEEGTFTPDWRGASALGTTSYGTYNVGSYIKIGNQVTVRGYSEITGSSGGSGMWFINNLPFVVKNGHGYRSVGSVLLENFNLDSDILDIVCYANPNVNDMHLRGNRDDANYSGNIRANSDTDFEVAWTITYQVA